MVKAQCDRQCRPECIQPCPEVVGWEEFLADSTVEDGSLCNEWNINYGEDTFNVKYESFLMYPLSLQGAVVFRIIRRLPGQRSYTADQWWIYVQAELGGDHRAEAQRAVWCHLARRKGDDRRLYTYDRLDKDRPEGAIGQPTEMVGGIKRWRIQRDSSVVLSTYLYITADGRRATVILVDGINGPRWENSLDYEKRYPSLEKAEKPVIRVLAANH